MIIGLLLLISSIVFRRPKINFPLWLLITWYVVSWIFEAWLLKRESIKEFFKDSLLFFSNHFLMCSLFIYCNPHVHIIGIYALLGGGILNFIVCMANKTKMPVCFPTHAIQDNETYISMSDPHVRTRLNFLGDWIPIWHAYWSPGDILANSYAYLIAIQFFFFMG